jgi:spermidine/putrescine transport system substrate-binding protein
MIASCGRRGREEASRIPDALESELAIYNWSDYIGDDTVAGFEREFGVRVTYDTYESNEDLLAKLQAGARGYDLICPSNYLVPALLALDLLAPLDRRFLTNWDQLSPAFLDRPFDPGNRFTVPWQWGVAGLAVRTDLVNPAPDSWGVFHAARYRGKMTQLDDMRDVIGAWLLYRGHSPNSRNPAELEQAKADALRAKPLLQSYLSAPVKGQLITGDVWIAHLWNGDTAQATAVRPALEFVVPREGGLMYLDSMAIPRTAPHQRAAHEFLNYTLRPPIAAAIADRTGYGSPNAGGLALQRRPVLPPERELLDRLEYQEDLGEATALWDRIWTEIKAG